MNVKIEEQKLRFKILEEELNALLSGKFLEQKIQILDKALIIIIDPKGEGDEFSPKLILDQDEICLRLLISSARLHELSDMGRSRKGLDLSVGGLYVSLQVDVRGDSRKAEKKDHPA